MAAARIIPKRDVRAFLEALAIARPDAETELRFTSPFTLLVAVVLSAQATDASVNKATAGLFREAPDPAAMLRLGEAGVARHIRSIGLWQGKARNVVALSEILLREHGGAVPRDRAALEALPGVGRKTANVVLNVAFGESTMAVDTHIFRLGNRTGLAPGATPRAVEDALVARIPADLLRPAHHLLILHGRYVCRARRPECWRCVVAQWCRYPDKTPHNGGVKRPTLSASNSPAFASDSPACARNSPAVTSDSPVVASVSPVVASEAKQPRKSSRASVAPASRRRKTSSQSHGDA